MLWDLKQENNSFDLDSAYDQYDRAREMSAALELGTMLGRYSFAVPDEVARGELRLLRNPEDDL
ncbi:hypothetical protein CNN82_02910 [Pseudomonas frederiksbergensis]|uniref:Uncharacterized protein n=1 Tax=Pseudomonas frederiksbergensis TaxID=104087 RepID=A0AB33E4L8_9PSED|nr:hypothetical protein PGR6_52480 [Pseudomonas sp. GR 6-02]ATE75413.1 hypothetical protein CNN82_02910 [Pseudomonas frederiksbergensis]GID06317.1 hypothetical protein TMM008_35190 [Pseudomonas sp. 008]